MELRETFNEATVKHILLVLSFFGIIFLLLTLLRQTGVLDPTQMRGFVESTGPWAPIIIMVLIGIGTVSLTMPSVPMIVLAGALFGPWLGALYAWIATVLGASFAFFVARFFKKYVIKMFGKNVEVLERFHQKYVAAAIFVSRVVPIFSFEIISYASGLTAITYRSYALVTAIGIIPSTLLFAFGGSFILEKTGEHFPIITALTMVVLVFIIPVLIARFNPFGLKDKLLEQKSNSH